MYGYAVCCAPRNLSRGSLMSSPKRAALYVRVSTDAQTVENQTRELRQVAKRRCWDVVEVYSDAGISGAKGRNGRPGLDTMLKDANGQTRFPANGRLCGVRADDDPPTHQSWAQARGRPGRETRSPEDRQRDRAEGAKAACERCGYLEGRQIARHRHWHGAAHRKRASDEPARGGAMTSGPQLTNSLLRRAGPPGRGDFCFGDFTHAPSPENLPKNGFCPRKGVAFL